MSIDARECIGKRPEIRALRKFARMVKPFFTSNKDKAKAWGWLVIMIILLMLESLFLVLFSYTQVISQGFLGLYSWRTRASLQTAAGLITPHLELVDP